MNFENLRNKKIEVHALIPSTNGVINCDDKGMLKTFTDINGKKHQRVSSQCQNRAVREELDKRGFDIGKRCSGEEFYEIMADELKVLNVSENDINKILNKCKKDDKKDDKNDNHLSSVYKNAKDMGYHFSKNEIKYIAEAIVNNGNKYDKKIVNDCVKKFPKSIDVIFHGRMNASNHEEDVRGAMETSDAIAINTMVVDEDYRTLVSDNKNRQGSINIGTVAQSSSVFYKHFIINCNDVIANANADEEYIKELFSWKLLKYYTAFLGNGKHNAKHSMTEPCYIAIVISDMGYSIPFEVMVNKNTNDAIDSIHNYLEHRKSSPMEDEIKFAEYSMNGLYHDDIEGFVEKELLN